MTTTWTIGSVELQRVPYFDIGLPAESIGLEGIAASTPWSEPWITDGEPTVGQAFWIIRSGGKTVVVDPCGASDDFLRSGPDAIAHQEAAFAALVSSGCEPDDVNQVVLTHLDGIGMTALADGAPAGEETWTPAFANAPIVIPEREDDFIQAAGDDATIPGRLPYLALHAQGAIEPVATPHAIAPGVELRHTGGHSPGHACVHIESEGARAVLLGHLAISPLHAARGVNPGHTDPETAWDVFTELLDGAADDGALLTGSLWPDPGAALVTRDDGYTLIPA